MNLTIAQKRVLREINETGFVEHKSRFGMSQSNRPAWALVNLELAEFGWGPIGSMLKTQGFLPTPAGRSALTRTNGGTGE